MLTAIVLAGIMPPVPCNAHPVYALTARASVVRVQRVSGTFRASARLSFKIVEKVPSVITSITPGLMDHVRGHQIIAQKLAKTPVSVTAVGASAAFARAQLRAAIERTIQDQNRELAREERVYDSVTENGAAQSQGPLYGFPGGPDAHDPCMRQ